MAFSNETEEIDDLLDILGLSRLRRSGQRQTATSDERTELTMITGELKRRIDALWTEFWQGGITNPLTVIEQITFLMFARLLDINETRDENRRSARASHSSAVSTDDEQNLRWSHFRHLGADEMLPLVRDKVFPHFRTASTSGTAFAEFMKDAQLMIQKPSLLVKAVNMIDAAAADRRRHQGRSLRVPAQQAHDGRHQRPVPHAAPHHPPDGGDAGAEADRYRRRSGVRHRRLPRQRDAISPAKPTPHPRASSRKPIRKRARRKRSTRAIFWRRTASISAVGMFHGFDFDATMLRIAAMNLMLHGVDDPDIHYQDTLSASFTDKFPKAATEGFDVILANPPFKGSLDFEDVHASLLRQVKTKKTELLFLALILRMLKTGGRSATIVPDGVLFGSSTAHVALRKLLLDENQLEAVISLPSGVFKPYAGVSTGILVFTKGGRTDNVFFYDVEADGFSLDDKRDPVDANDLPDCLVALEGPQSKEG